MLFPLWIILFVSVFPSTNLVYGCTVLKGPFFVRSLKLSNIGHVSTWMGDRLGIRDATG